MKIADLPQNEPQRLAALHSYQILDTPPEKAYDELTRLAAGICNAPIAAICLIDSERTWFKSVHGVNITEVSRRDAFCTHAILSPNVFEVFDARLDERFYDNPQISGPVNIISYTAVPLINLEGHALGALCVIDHAPRKYNEFQLESLKTLAHQVVYLMKVKKRNIQLENLKQTLEHKNKELEQFAYIVAHDIKNPVANMLLTSEILEKDYATKLDDKGRKFLSYMKKASYKVSDLVNGILEFYRTDAMAAKKFEMAELTDILQSVIDIIKPAEHINLNFPTENIALQCNKTVLEQIFQNLLHNAIKYNDKDEITLSVLFDENEHFYQFTVKDNGPGIAPENHEKIFNLFTSLQIKDRYNQHSTGIGLATVKKLVERAGGEIRLTSAIGHGAEFTFTIKKATPADSYTESYSNNNLFA